MTKNCGSVVAVVTQRRRNRPMVAMQVAPKCPRPQALRDLYPDARRLIRQGESAELAEPAEVATTSASRTSR